MTTPTSLAWHNDPALKAEVMQRLRKHREQDAIVQGVYQKLDPDKATGYRGCAIGCTLPLQPGGWNGDPTPTAGVDGWHAEVARTYGIHRNVAECIDDIFEALGTSDAGQFAVDAIEAIPVGADLSHIAAEPLRSGGRYEWVGGRAQAAATNLIADLKAAPVVAEATP